MALAAKLMADPTMSIPNICRTLRDSRTSLYCFVGPRDEFRQRKAWSLQEKYRLHFVVAVSILVVNMLFIILDNTLMQVAI